MADSVTLDQIAGARLEEALKNSMHGEDVIVIAGTAYIQANLSQALNFALVRILMHKNFLSEAELARSIAWAYDERRVRLEEKGSIVVAGALPPVTVRGKN